MNAPRALVVALALSAAPASALGQTVPPLRAPWGGDLPPPPPPPRAPLPHFFDPPPEAPDSRPGRGARIGYETLGGFAGAVGGAVVTVAAGCTLAPNECPDSSRELGTFAILAASVNLVAIPLGVTLAGHLSQGDGGFGWAFLGSVGGMSLALPAAVLFASTGSGSSRSARYTGIGAVLTLLPMFGSVLAYELSVPSRARPRRIEREARVTPVFDVRPDGASAGATIVF